MSHIPLSATSRTAPSGPIRRLARAIAGVVLVSGGLLLSAPPAQAQNAVGGVVVSAQTGQPLPGAQIAVEGTGRGTLSDAEGRFLIPGLDGGEATLRVVMLGYRTVTRTVAVGRTDVRIELASTAISLDEIVVTGTPGGAQARAIGNTVATVDAVEVAEIAPPPDVQQLIGARVPGLRIQKSAGEVGTGGTTTIRGVGSVTLSHEPLIFIDGVRVDNNPVDAGSAFDAVSAPSRINDLDPGDIESIEVIKGPAAATLYGTEASNGVIQIITKKGTAGEPSWQLDVTQGANFLQDPEEVFPTVWGRDPASGELISLNIIENDIREGYGSPFRTGHSQGYDLSLRGGTESLRYYLSGGLERDQGIVSYNWQDNLNARSNLTYLHGEDLEIGLNLGIIRQTTRAASAAQPITTHIIWGLPQLAETSTRGYLAVTPEDFEDVEGIEELDRSTISVQITHTPLEWFSHRLAVGGDLGGSRSYALFPRTEEQPGPFGNASRGEKEVTHRRTAYQTVDYSATATANLTPSLTSRTSTGAQFYRKRVQTDRTEGQVFPVPQIETVTGGATRFAFEDFLENRTFGVFVQEQVGWNNRLFLTGAVRGDDNSAFGQNYDFVVYPKASASWVLTEEPFFQDVPVLNTLKLRTAWGRAGQQPDVFAAIRLYQPATGQEGVPTLTPENIGNPDLKPEVGEELELGFDASLLDERIGLQFTYYDQTTTDAIVSKPVKPSVGFPGEQFVNVGEVANRGVEFGLDAQIVRRDDFGWDLGFTLSTNENEIVELGGVDLGTNSFGQRYLEGWPLGSVFMPKVVDAEFAEDGSLANLRCEGGDPVTGGGPPVPCDEAGTAYFGQPVPTWEGSVSSTITLFDDLRLYALVDFLGGHIRVNGDLGASHLFFRNSRCIHTRCSPILAGYDDLNQVWQTGIHDGGFAKLRTVSASYTLPERLVAAFGASRGAFTLSGQNVATLWIAEDNTYGHPITDPEIRSQDSALTVFNQEKWPQFTRVQTTLRLTF